MFTAIVRSSRVETTEVSTAEEVGNTLRGHTCTRILLGLQRKEIHDTSWLNLDAFCYMK